MYSNFEQQSKRMQHCVTYGTARAAIAVILVLVCAYAQANSYPDQMQFSTFLPCRGNSSSCAKTILARGIIDNKAADRLREILQDWDDTAGNPIRPRIAFDSPGGSLLEAIQIGYLLRERRASTVVDNRYDEDYYITKGEDLISKSRVVDSYAVCYSACVYAFMGGVSRAVKRGARIGVHQFKGENRTITGTTAQVVMSRLLEYVENMGVDPVVVRIASLVAPTSVEKISNSRAEKINLDNQNPPLTPWTVKALSSGKLVAHVSRQRYATDRITMLSLTLSREQEGIFIVGVEHGPYHHSVIARVRSMISGNPEPEICVLPEDSYRSRCAKLDVLVPWKYSDEQLVISITYAVDIDKLLSILNSGIEQFSYDGGFPHVYGDLRPGVNLGYKRLLNALKALMRSN